MDSRETASDGGVERSRRAQSLLSCALCSQYFEDPRLLPCGHTFCRKCLERYYNLHTRHVDVTGRSPSSDGRRRGLLPCPAAPVCVHVAIVPEGGVAAFPVDARIARIKERVVSEMAEDISRRIGIVGSSDTASTLSDLTDDTSYSAPTANGFNSDEDDAERSPRNQEPSSGSRYPNLSKYARYFDRSEKMETDPSSEYTPGVRSERRRLGYSSSFQHRRRRVNTPTPSTCDDTSASDFIRRQPSRCGSAPHLDDVTALHDFRRRNHQTTAGSPLTRRKARPTSAILEELYADERNDDMKNGTGQSSFATSPKTPRRAFSTDRLEQRPEFRERFGNLPTHRENVMTEEKVSGGRSESVPQSSSSSSSKTSASGYTETETSRQGRPESHGSDASRTARVDHGTPSVPGEKVSGGTSDNVPLRSSSSAKASASGRVETDRSRESRPASRGCDANKIRVDDNTPSSTASVSPGRKLPEIPVTTPFRSGQEPPVDSAASGKIGSRLGQGQGPSERLSPSAGRSGTSGMRSYSACRGPRKERSNLEARNQSDSKFKADGNIDYLATSPRQQRRENFLSAKDRECHSAGPRGASNASSRLSPGREKERTPIGRARSPHSGGKKVNFSESRNGSDCGLSERWGLDDEVIKKKKVPTATLR